MFDFIESLKGLIALLGSKRWDIKVSEQPCHQGLKLFARIDPNS